MEPDPKQRHALALRMLPLLDLTSLGEDDSPARIEALCAAARTPWGLPAAVCVYPEHIVTVRRALAAVRVATVVNFPDGGENPDRTVRETRRAIAAGADEIDLVFPFRALRRGDLHTGAELVRACRVACGPAVTLKLIVESGELTRPELIRQACEIGLGAGVDFLKTSTGKVPVNATPAAAVVMLDAIARAGGRCGFKVAGGVRTLTDAALYLGLAESALGASWISPEHFRIGASALFGELRAALEVPA
ncbi:MAG TPA: deoxyribose-phosphate aldolase [Rhodanobacteraceae bacterium]|nr:deoxyribose-phosphate aldolase [Rhodanobacteraceae bacterium]